MYTCLAILINFLVKFPFLKRHQNLEVYFDIYYRLTSIFLLCHIQCICDKNTSIISQFTLFPVAFFYSSKDSSKMTPTTITVNFIKNINGLMAAVVVSRAFGKNIGIKLASWEMMIASNNSSSWKDSCFAISQGSTNNTL